MLFLYKHCWWQEEGKKGDGGQGGIGLERGCEGQKQQGSKEKKRRKEGKKKVRNSHHTGFSKQECLWIFIGFFHSQSFKFLMAVISSDLIITPRDLLTLKRLWLRGTEIMKDLLLGFPHAICTSSTAAGSSATDLFSGVYLNTGLCFSRMTV